jgi:hypothetical protein
MTEQAKLVQAVQAKLLIGWRLRLALALGYTLAAAILLAALGFVLQPMALVWLSRRSLPGFEVSVPAGEVTDRAVTYAVGRLIVHTALVPALVSVRWDPQVTDEQELTLRMTAEAKAQGGTLARSEMRLGDGQRVSLWHLSVGAEAWFSYVRCGGRQIQITSSAGLRGVDRVHRRIVTSIRCHPDPAGEAGLGDVPVVLSLPPGYRRAPAATGELQFASDRKVVEARLWAGHASPEAGAHAIEESGVLGPGLHLGRREGKQFSVESEDPENQQFGWVRALDCPAWGGSVWLIGLSRISRDDAREVQEILRQARCRAEGEPAPRWPE